MIHLASWGYAAGYLELEETYLISALIADRLQSTFASWDEASENYLDGYAYWPRTDVSLDNSKFKDRTQIYEDLKNQQEQNGILFDPNIWLSPIIHTTPSS